MKNTLAKAFLGATIFAVLSSMASAAEVSIKTGKFKSDTEVGTVKSTTIGDRSISNVAVGSVNAIGTGGYNVKIETGDVDTKVRAKDITSMVVGARSVSNVALGSVNAIGLGY